jgi:hypothetical protein
LCATIMAIVEGVGISIVCAINFFTAMSLQFSCLHGFFTSSPLLSC